MAGRLIGKPDRPGGPEGDFRVRFEHAAVLIPPGRADQCSALCGSVMVVGGDQYRQDPSGLNLSAEAFNPSTGKWQALPAPNRIASGVAFFLERDRSALCGKLCGKVLMIGPTVRGQSAAEFFDAVEMRWIELAMPAISLGLGAFTATLLPSGEILVLGGVATAAKPSSGAVAGSGQPSDPALYDPGKDSWRLLSGAGSVFRNGHSASLLTNGRILIAGGMQTETSKISRSTDLLASEVFRPGPSLNSARSHHVAMSLDNGGVIVLGGTPPAKKGQGPSASFVPPPAEQLDPARKRFSVVSNAPEYRGSLRKTTGPVFTAVRLANGRILVAGGIGIEDRALRSAEIYNAGENP